MKKSMKEMLIETVADMAKNREDNIFEVEERKLDELLKKVEKLEKFTVIKNKKNDKLLAVAYKTKKSDRIVIIKIVENVKQQVKTESRNNKILLKTVMEKDAGLAVHRAEFTIKNVKEGFLSDFLSAINDKIKDSKLGESAEMVDVEFKDGSYVGYIEFPKIKGHSKDGYANYKKCMTEAKKQMRAC